jgi:6-phosphogluconate dehydrogenase
MELGMVGLGRMGANIVRRLVAAGHRCVGFDVHEDSIAAVEADGVEGARTLDELVDALAPPRAVWMMVPAALTGSIADDVAKRLSKGDTLIDGGNSYYRDDIARAEAFRPKGIHYVDVGTSGGVFGLDRGFCLMIGGDDEAVGRLGPIFASLAPGVAAAPRTPARGKAGPETTTAEQGYLHCGPTGAGHFVKMVHNGIEYGLMAAFAEGFAILHRADEGDERRLDDAETAPLREPEMYQYRIDVPAVAELWRRGSVVGSWLLDLTADALATDPDLEGFEGRVSDSGEGRWTVQAAVELGVPAPVLSAALFERFASRGEFDYSGKLLSAMRKEFGGHVERKN